MLKSCCHITITWHTILIPAVYQQYTRLEECREGTDWLSCTFDANFEDEKQQASVNYAIMCASIYKSPLGASLKQNPFNPMECSLF